MLPPFVRTASRPLLIAAVVLASACASDAEQFCAGCGPDEVCVQHFDGVCGPPRLECMARHAACSLEEGCSAACDLQCKRGDPNASGPSCASYCPDQIAGVLACHGP